MLLMVGLEKPEPKHKAKVSKEVSHMRYGKQKTKKIEAAGLICHLHSARFERAINCIGDIPHRRFGFHHLEVDLEVAWLQWQVASHIYYNLFSILYCFS